MQQVMLERGLGDEFRVLAIWIVAIGACFLLAAALGRVRRGVHALLGGLAALWVLWGVGVAPLANDSVTSAAVMREVDRIAGPQGEVVMVAWKEQNLLMSPRPLKDFGFRNPRAEQFERAVAWLQAAPAQRWIFARQVAVEACVDRSRVTVAGASNRREWWMFQADAVRPGCRLPAPGAAAPDKDDDDSTD